MTPGENAILEILPAGQRTREERADPPRSGGSSVLVTGNGVAVSNRRLNPRLAMNGSVSIFPVLSDGSLDRSRSFSGSAVDVSSDGLGLEIEAPRDSVPGALAVGIAGPDGQMRFAGVLVCNTRSVGPSRVRLGGRFAGRAHEMLSAGLLTPVFDAATMRYRPPADPDVLKCWVDARILTPRLLDRVQVCPRCESLATFRPACRACKSARVARERLIHHFKCAHVDRADAFDTPRGVVCPKCRLGPLIVGADFDYQEGLASCLDCGWSDGELVQVGHCFRCQFRFGVEQAKVLDLVGYHVQRLDPLVLLNPS